MKVMCIDSPDLGFKQRTGCEAEFIALVIGGHYNVINEELVSTIYGPIHLYELSEFQPDAYGDKFLFSASLFIPLSSIDETELIKERLQEA